MDIENTSITKLVEEHEHFGRIVAEIIASYTATLDERPVASASPVAELVRLFDEPLPQTGVSGDQLLERFEKEIIPNSMQIASPRYFGLFNPTPLAIGVWADALASALNQNGAVWRNSSAASVIEARVAQWLCEMVGYPASSFGALASGGSEANLVALKCARDRAGKGIRDRGLRAGPDDLVFYASEQCHYSFVKSVDILGMGRENLRKIPSDSKFHIDLSELRRQIEVDRRAGKVICGIGGVAGATSTGVIDPLNELADIALENSCWFHVDAAYGGALALSDRHRHRLNGIERADSITLDPHKWMFVPFACGAVLVREGGGVLRESFDITPEYLSEDRGGADVEYDFLRYGQLGTRRFNALKIWMALKSVGVQGYGRLIDRQIALTEYFGSLINSLPGFERVGEIETAVCCFRFVPESAAGSARSELDRIQQQLQQRIEQSGDAWLATTVLHGRRALRVNINSFLTQKEHVEHLVELLRRESLKLQGE